MKTTVQDIPAKRECVGQSPHANSHVVRLAVPAQRTVSFSTLKNPDKPPEAVRRQST